MGGGRDLTSGACGAWLLPGDVSCAASARALYRDAAAEVGIGAELAYDGVTMVSELAANTLHSGGPGACGPAELWLYLRGRGDGRELVCEVFDPCPDWKSGTAPSPYPRPVPPEATGGRGLQVVHELSGGRWGHHPTRARLGGWRVRGKAVWFALPAPLRACPWPTEDDGQDGTERAVRLTFS